MKRLIGFYCFVATGCAVDVATPAAQISPSGATVPVFTGLASRIAPNAPFRDWDRATLASALRVATMDRGGQTHVETEPAWDRADRVRADDGSERVVEALRRVEDPRRDARTEYLGSAQLPYVFGSDNRWVTQTWLSPYRNTAKITTYNGGTPHFHCSGFFIGPWTFVTSAHCMIAAGPTYLNRVVFEPARQGVYMPYSIDCSNGDGSSTNDFATYWPADYVSYGVGYADNPLDYFLIDTYPCFSAPYAFPDFAVNTSPGTEEIVGYPGAACPNAPSGYDYQCSASGYAYWNGWRLETAAIDMTSGQSGGPWMRTDATYGYLPTAINQEERTFWDFGMCGFDLCYRNDGHGFDAAFEDFVITYSYDY